MPRQGKNVEDVRGDLKEESASSSSNVDEMVMKLLGKRLRRYQKSLRRISETEKLKSEGKFINKDQEDLISSKPVVLRLVEEYEKLVADVEVLFENHKVDMEVMKPAKIKFGSIDFDQVILAKRKKEEVKPTKTNKQKKDTKKIVQNKKEEVIVCSNVKQGNDANDMGNKFMTLAQVVKEEGVQKNFWEIDEEGNVYRMGASLQSIIFAIVNELTDMHKNGVSHEGVKDMNNIVFLQNNIAYPKLINIQNKHCANVEGIVADFTGLKALITVIMNEHKISLSNALKDLQDFLNVLDRPLSHVKNRAIIMGHPALWDSKRRVQFIVNITRLMCNEPALDYRIRRWLANERELDNWFYKISKVGKLQEMLKASPGSFFFHYTTEGSDLIRYMRRVYSYIIEYGSGKRGEEKLSMEALERIFHKLFPRLLVVLHQRLT